MLRNLQRNMALKMTRIAIYRWRHELNQIKQGEQIDTLQTQGYSFEQAKKILELEAEIVEYQKKLSEQVVINDLLKKLHGPQNSALVKSASGLTDTIKLLGPKKKQQK